jgi:hypothetical protein
MGSEPGGICAGNGLGSCVTFVKFEPKIKHDAETHVSAALPANPTFFADSR